MLDHKTRVNWFFGGTVIYLWHAWILIDLGKGKEVAEGKPIITAPGIPAHTDIFTLWRRPSLTIKRKPRQTREACPKPATSMWAAGIQLSPSLDPSALLPASTPTTPPWPPIDTAGLNIQHPKSRVGSRAGLRRGNSHAAHSPSCRMPWDSVR